MKKLLERKCDKMFDEIAKDLGISREDCKAHAEHEGLFLLNASDYIMIPKCVA